MAAVRRDSNVLIDLMSEDADWFPWSAKAIENAADTARLVINAVIYGEVSVRYSRVEDLEAVNGKVTRMMA